MVPIAAAAIGLVGGIWWAFARRTGVSPSPALLCAAVLIAGLGLLLADPRFPAKRIHVPEYIVVAWLVRAGLRHHLDGWSLTVGATLIAGLYGVHDELIQGLHPKRTYGLMDMATNACGAATGALLTHAFDQPRSQGRGLPGQITLSIAGLATMLSGVTVMLIALSLDTGTASRTWAYAPLALAVPRVVCNGSDMAPTRWDSASGGVRRGVVWIDTALSARRGHVWLGVPLATGRPSLSSIQEQCEALAGRRGEGDVSAAVNGPSVSPASIARIEPDHAIGALL